MADQDNISERLAALGIDGLQPAEPQSAPAAGGDDSGDDQQNEIAGQFFNEANGTYPSNLTMTAPEFDAASDRFNAWVQASGHAAPGSLSRNSSTGVVSFKGNLPTEKVNLTANERIAFDYYTKVALDPNGHHWTAAAACGFIANHFCESGCNPGAIGDGGLAKGILQAHGERCTELMQFGTDYESQLKGVNFALNQGADGPTRKLGKYIADHPELTAEQVADLFCRMAERPANPYGDSAKRQAVAAGLEQKLVAEGPAPTQTPDTVNPLPAARPGSSAPKKVALAAPVESSGEKPKSTVITATGPKSAAPSPAAA